MRFINVNFNNVIQDLLPVDNRKAGLIAYCRSMIAGIKSLHQSVINERRRNLYALNHGQHVAHVEGVLNDAFDRGFRRIKVVDAPLQYEPLYLFQDAEQKPKYVYTDAENMPTHVFTDYEVEFEGIDFVVQVPYTLPYDEGRMIYLIEKYKTPGMAYIIEQVL